MKIAGEMFIFDAMENKNKNLPIDDAGNSFFVTSPGISGDYEFTADGGKTWHQGTVISLTSIPNGLEVRVRNQQGEFEPMKKEELENEDMCMKSKEEIEAEIKRLEGLESEIPKYNLDDLRMIAANISGLKWALGLSDEYGFYYKQ